MPININPPNFGGLASSGASGGIPNLSVPGALGLQGLQAGNANRNAALDRRQRDEEMLIRQGMQQQQLAQQGLLASQQNQLEQQKIAQQGGQFAQGAQFDAAKLALQQGQNDRAFGQDERRLDIEKQKADQESQAKEMAKLIDMNKSQIREKGAFASYGLLSMKGAKSPGEANQIRSEILKEAVANKHISAEEAAQAAKAPLSAFTNGLAYKIMQYGAADDYKTMMSANAPPKSAMGTQIEFNEDGSIKSLSLDPSGPLKKKVGEELLDRQQGLQQLAGIRDKFDEANFTYAGKAGRGASAVAELSKGTPGLEQVTELAAKTITGKGAEDRGEDLKNATQYLNSVEQFFNTYRKDITGAAAAEKELERLRASFINSDLSPSQFKGALDQLLTKYTSEAEFKKNVLNKGVDTTPDLFAQYRNSADYKDWSDAEIKQAMKGSK